MKKNIIAFTVIEITAIVLSLCLVWFIGNHFDEMAEIVFEKGLSLLKNGDLTNGVSYDSDSIPFIDYGGSVGKRYNAVLIAYDAVNLYDSIVAGNTLCKNRFEKYIEWLLANCEKNKFGFLYYYDFYWNPYDLDPGWRCALTQGRAASAMIKAYIYYNDEEYLNYARMYIKCFESEIESGGVALKDKNGWWYEEYSQENKPHPMILNGMLTALLSLNELYCMTNDSTVGMMFEKGNMYVKSVLDSFDDNGYSYYDLQGHYASPFYHKKHIWQLRKMFEITGDSLYLNYECKWDETQNSMPIILRLIKFFSRRLLGIVFTEFVFVLFALNLIFLIYSTITKKNSGMD